MNPINHLNVSQRAEGQCSYQDILTTFCPLVNVNDMVKETFSSFGSFYSETIKLNLCQVLKCPFEDHWLQPIVDYSLNVTL